MSGWPTPTQEHRPCLALSRQTPRVALVASSRQSPGHEAGLQSIAHVMFRVTQLPAMTLAPSSPLCLLTVHAHPDDEASKGSATVAKYVSEGVRTVLVCCTGGEAGEVLNKAMDTPEVVANLAAIRARELQASVAAIGYTAV